MAHPLYCGFFASQGMLKGYMKALLMKPFGPFPFKSPLT